MVGFAVPDPRSWARAVCAGPRIVRPRATVDRRRIVAAVRGFAAGWAAGVRGSVMVASCSVRWPRGRLTCKTGHRPRRVTPAALVTDLRGVGRRITGRPAWPLGQETSDVVDHGPPRLGTERC